MDFESNHDIRLPSLLLEKKSLARVGCADDGESVEDCILSLNPLRKDQARIRGQEWSTSYSVPFGRSLLVFSLFLSILDFFSSS